MHGIMYTTLHLYSITSGRNCQLTFNHSHSTKDSYIPHRKFLSSKGMPRREINYRSNLVVPRCPKRGWTPFAMGGMDILWNNPIIYILQSSYPSENFTVDCHGVLRQYRWMTADHLHLTYFGMLHYQSTKKKA